MAFGFIGRYIMKNRLFTRGSNAFMQGDFELALTSFQEIISIDENMALAHVNAGLCLLRLGRRQEAEESFSRGRDLFPNNPVPHVCLGQIAYENAEYDVAHEHLENALKVDKTHPEAMYYLGLTLLRQGKEEEAAAAFEPMINDRRNYVLARLLCAAEKYLYETKSAMEETGPGRTEIHGG